MQTLGPTLNGCHGLNRRPYNVIHGLCLRQGISRSLAVRPQEQRFWIFGLKLLFHQLGPKPPRCPHFRNLHVILHADAPKEAEAGCDNVDRKVGLMDSRSQVFQTISEGKGQFQGGIGSGFLHVIATDTNGIVFRHFSRKESHNVGHDPIHTGLWRVNIRVAHHEFFQNVVLNRPLELCQNGILRFFRRLFQGGLNVHGQDG
mmetsp:Transcript_10656/g.19433  ORF Transcript_10656/g.19433 Transcript_10656/m.19433 type:complete len:202 (-) Transcript_10656:897-1502(-)